MSEPLQVTDGQAARLRELLRVTLAGNRFYREKLQNIGISADGDADAWPTLFRQLPFTVKQALSEDQEQHPPFGTNLAYEVSSYNRFHQTSGSTGKPLRWLDDAAGWSSMLSCWEQVFKAAGIGKGDRVFFAFSFGPFLGFWTAFEAAARLGCICIPGGGMSTTARLRLLLDVGASAVCCTPTYAIRMGEAAAEAGLDLAESGVRRVIVAGEPGGSIPAVRDRIAALWPGASAFDHHGMTEVGPVTYECAETPGLLHVVEDAYFVEVIDPQSGELLPEGCEGELVLTTLQRVGSPLLRYRTGDLVRPRSRGTCSCGTDDLALEGGILGRCDDMVVVRGVNLYPAAVDAIVRRIAEVVEYRVEIRSERGMDEVKVYFEVVPGADERQLAGQVAEELRAAFNLRIPVEVVAADTLPRFEMKAKRWIRL